MTGDRPGPLDPPSPRPWRRWPGNGPRVLVVTLDGAGSPGELRAVGRDVLTMRLDGAGRREVYVSVAAVAEVSLAL